ncbi:MAG: hypothetical protein FWG25_01955 [Promicromonosporaceae bacterium]|nr:hypothetical protein [Promicromonosporaceae bacterium]
MAQKLGMGMAVWNDSAFVARALPALTDALGLYLVLDHLDAYLRISPDQTDFSYVNPLVVEQLRAEWIDDARRHLPGAVHAEVAEKVASAENFRIALVGHLDQVPFPPGIPKWVRLLKVFAVGLTALAVFTVLYVIFHGMPVHYLSGPILAAELMVVGAGVCAMTSLVARDRYQSRLLATVSTAVRQELRMAIQHGFANPITELAQNAYKTELPKLP